MQKAPAWGALPPAPGQRNGGMQRHVALRNRPVVLHLLLLAPLSSRIHCHTRRPAGPNRADGVNRCNPVSHTAALRTGAEKGQQSTCISTCSAGFTCAGATSLWMVLNMRASSTCWLTWHCTAPPRSSASSSPSFSGPTPATNRRSRTYAPCSPGFGMGCQTQIISSPSPPKPFSGARMRPLRWI